ncbi:MAG TPA: ribonuclease P protein component [Candidatus Coprenecus pullistercoris]|nr:ribonuclease P protein component [Candidatus Coprenecus pullistercoris]
MTRTERIHSEGRKIHSYPYRLYVLDNGEGEEDCVVISVPKKLFKRAVRRNLIRRRTREALRHCRADFPEISGKGMILVYIADKVLDYGQITDGLRNLLAKIQ